jgi:hypothetical protein
MVDQLAGVRFGDISFEVPRHGRSPLSIGGHEDSMPLIYHLTVVKRVQLATITPAYLFGEVCPIHIQLLISKELWLW